MDTVEWKLNQSARRASRQQRAVSPTEKEKARQNRAFSNSSSEAILLDRLLGGEHGLVTTKAGDRNVGTRGETTARSPRNTRLAVEGHRGRRGVGDGRVGDTNCATEADRLGNCRGERCLDLVDVVRGTRNAVELHVARRIDDAVEVT